MATTQDDGGNYDSLNDTPEMRRLIEIIRKHPAPHKLLERLVAKALADEEGSAETPEPPEGKQG